jgi:hypothetical protein
MVTGAVAMIIYGEPRLTQDIDLVIELKIDEARKIEEAFPPKSFTAPLRKALRLRSIVL